MMLVEKLFGMVTALGILFVGLALVVAILRLWVGRLSDLIWIVALKPRLGGAITLAWAYVTLVFAYWIIPQHAGVPVALPVLVMVILTPILARPTVNLLATRAFGRFNEPFDVDENTLKVADVFLLEEIRLRTLYRAPVSEPPID